MYLNILFFSKLKQFPQIS